MEGDSTCAETPYSHYHLWVENLIAAELGDCEVVVLRVTNPYGPAQISKRGQGFVSAVIRSLKENRELSIYGDGSLSRDYLHERDLLCACAAILERPINPSSGFSVFNMGTGVASSQLEVLELVEKVFGARPKVFFAAPRERDLRRSVVSPQKFRIEFDWEPKIDLLDGIITYKSYMCS